MPTRALTGLVVATMLAANAAAAEPLKVVATFSILGDLVHQVGGPDVAVTTLVGPDGDAHVYQPSPGDARAVAEAAVVFRNGLGFEGWLARLVQSSGTKAPLVTTTADITPQTMVEEEGLHAGQRVTDPHAWQRVANVQIYIRNIADGLAKADPAHADAYRSRATAYSGELAALESFIQQKVASVPKAQRKVITSHDAFGYYGSAYGIRFIAPQGVSTESEASAKQVASLIRQIRREKVGAVFVESITDPRMIEQIAREAKVKVGGTLHSDALARGNDPAATYLGMMRDNTEKLAAAMAGE